MQFISLLSTLTRLTKLNKVTITKMIEDQFILDIILNKPQATQSGARLNGIVLEIA